MTTWRDRITLADELPGLPSRPWTPTGRATVEAMLDYLDPILGLSLLPTPVVISWMNMGVWQAQSTTNWVGLHDPDGTVQDHGGWEPYLVHELLHVIDKQLMNDADRATIMATLTSPPNPPVGGDQIHNWLDGTYFSEAGEAFAAGYSQHLWFVERLGYQDDSHWGMYSYDPPVFVAACVAAVDAALTRHKVILTPLPPVVPIKPSPPPVVVVVVKPPLNHAMTRAIQTAVRIVVDGAWGPATLRAGNAVTQCSLTDVRYLQARVGTKVDGSWGSLSQAAWVATIKKIQMAMGVTQTGSFDSSTKAAWLKNISINYRA